VFDLVILKKRVGYSFQYLLSLSAISPTYIVTI